MLKSTVYQTDSHLIATFELAVGWHTFLLTMKAHHCGPRLGPTFLSRFPLSFEFRHLRMGNIKFFSRENWREIERQTYGVVSLDQKDVEARPAREREGRKRDEYQRRLKSYLESDGDLPVWRDDLYPKEFPTVSTVVTHAKDFIARKSIYELSIRHVDTFPRGKGFMPGGSGANGDVHHGTSYDAYRKALAQGQEMLDQMADELERSVAEQLLMQRRVTLFTPGGNMVEGSRIDLDVSIGSRPHTHYVKRRKSFDDAGGFVIEWLRDQLVRGPGNGLTPEEADRWIEGLEPKGPRVTELTDDNRALLERLEHKGVDLGDDLASLPVNVLLGAKRARCGRALLVEWEGTKVPRGAFIDGREIAWTQNGQVHVEGGEVIGAYTRLVEWGGPTGKLHIMIVYPYGE